MNKYLTKGRIALLVIFSVLIADQIIKIYVKTHMYWHQSENAIKWLYEKLGMVDADAGGRIPSVGRTGFT